MSERQLRITSTADFDARLAELGRVGGDLADLEAAVRVLASRLDKPVGSNGLLKLARLGWASYCRPTLVPSAQPPRFLGRPEPSLPPAGQPGATAAAHPRGRPDGSSAAAPRTTPSVGESTVEYARHLGEDLARFLDEEGVVVEPDGDLVPVYACYLAREDVRGHVGWRRSQDLHALAVLLHERVSRGAGFDPVSAEVEEALFRWVHLATHEEVTPADLAEQRARRAVRLAHAEQPAAQVAVMTCEVPLTEEMGFEQLSDHLQDIGLTREQLLSTFRANATRGARWAALHRGIEDTGRLELGQAASDRDGVADRAAHAEGHLLRWLLDHDVTVSSLLMALAHEYSRGVVRALGAGAQHEPAKASPVHAHLVTVLRLGREVRLRLPDELVLFAWLCEQTGIAIRLDGFLAARERVMARAASAGA